MNKEQLENVTCAVLYVSALAEAICGKRFIKRICKRLKVLNSEAVVEVWVGVHNSICSDNPVSTGNNAFAHSPIVKAESELILDKMLENQIKVDDELIDKVRRISLRKVNDYLSVLKNLYPHGIK